MNEIQEFNSVLELTDNIINRKYLSCLTNNEKYRIHSTTMDALALDVSKHARIFHLRKLVYDTDENFLNKLITVVNVAYSLRGTIVTSIQSDGNQIDFYIGIVAKEKKGAAGEQNRDAILNAFEGTMSGNFSGSDIGEHIKNDELKKFSDAIDGNAVCSVSVVPSIRNADRSEIASYVQGIENLVDSLKGKKYAILTIADPVSSENILQIRRGYENTYNYLLPLYRVMETKSSTKTVTMSETETQNYVKGITDAISNTQNKTDNVNYSNGFNFGVSFILSAGFNHSKSHGESNSISVGRSHSTSEQTGISSAKTTGSSYSVGDSTQVTVENRIIKSMLDKIEKNIERIDECEGYGAFNSATYVIADDKETALNVAGNFTSLMKGDKSAAQASAINCWQKTEKPVSGYGTGKTPFDSVVSSLRHLSHPLFDINKDVSVSTSVLVSGPELTVQLGFPKKSINGLTVIPMHPFGRNPMSSSGERINLGNLYFMGKTEKQKVTLDLNSLSSHVFLTGSTGAGKSNAVYQILSELTDKGVPYLVIEPAKGEYKNVFGIQKGVNVYGTNPNKTQLLKINPFKFPSDIHVLEHIDRLIEIFNVCWPMYAAMPSVLKDAVERAYIESGWNFETSTNKYSPAIYPTFEDVLEELYIVINESDYSAELKGNYTGALVTRVKSLTTGLNGQIFVSDEIDNHELFDSNTIVDLSRVMSSETKAMIMGLLVMRLQEHRMSEGGMNRPLSHVTVLEEAHHLLKRTSTEQSSESSNLLGKSVEMLSQSMAEMRTYGEGFMIADQSPNMLDMSAIRNTNTKIILRLPDLSDRELCGRAANLNDNQIIEIAKFPTGVAAVYQNNWIEPVLCNISRYDAEQREYVYCPKRKINTDERLKQSLLRCLLSHSAKDRVEYFTDDMSRRVIDSDLSAHTKCIVLDALKSDSKEITDVCEAVTVLFDTRGLVESVAKITNLQKYNNLLLERLNFNFGNLNQEYQMLTIQCILKQKSLEKEEMQLTYSKWVEAMKGW